MLDKSAALLLLCFWIFSVGQVEASCATNFYLGLNLSAPSNYSCQPCTECSTVTTPCSASSDTVCAAASSSSALSTTWIIVIAVVGGSLVVFLLAFLVLRARRNNRTRPDRVGAPTNGHGRNATTTNTTSGGGGLGDGIQLRTKKEPQKFSLLQRLSSARSASTNASTDGGYVQIEALPDYIAHPLKPVRGPDLSVLDREALFAVFGEPLEPTDGETSFGFPVSREDSFASFVRTQSFSARDSTASLHTRDSTHSAFGFHESLEEESILETKGIVSARLLDLSLSPGARVRDSTTEVFSPVVPLSARSNLELRSRTQSPTATTPSPGPGPSMSPSLDTATAASRSATVSPAPGPLRSSTVPSTAIASPVPRPLSTASGAAVETLGDATTDSERWRALRTLREVLGTGASAPHDCIDMGAVPMLIDILKAADDSPDVQRETAMCLRLLARPEHLAELVQAGALEALAIVARADTEAQDDMLQTFVAIAPAAAERAELLLEAGLLSSMLRVLGRGSAPFLLDYIAPLARANPGLVTAAGGAKTLLAMPMLADTRVAELLLDALTALAAHMALPGVQVLAKTYKNHSNSKVRARATALAAGKQ